MHSASRTSNEHHAVGINAEGHTIMDLDYKQFRIEASCLNEGGRYYARAKILRVASEEGTREEVKWSGDIGEYRSEAEAVDAAQQWATRWCDEQAE